MVLTNRVSAYPGPDVFSERKAPLDILPLVFSLKYIFSCIRLLSKSVHINIQRESSPLVLQIKAADSLMALSYWESS